MTHKLLGYRIKCYWKRFGNDFVKSIKKRNILSHLKNTNLVTYLKSILKFLKSHRKRVLGTKVGAPFITKGLYLTMMVVYIVVYVYSLFLYFYEYYGYSLMNIIMTVKVKQEQSHASSAQSVVVIPLESWM